jgi:hypothetical protein
MNASDRSQKSLDKGIPIVRKLRFDRGMQFTSRDLQVLVWIGEQYAARFDQVQNLLSRYGPAGATTRPERLSKVRTREIIARWQSADLVETGRILHDEPFWIWLSNAGLAETNLSYHSLHPKPSTVQHLYYINQVRLMLAKERPLAYWTSERAIRSEQERRAFGSKVFHIPDGIVTLDGKQVAIEVELQAKESRRVKQIIHYLHQLTQYACVWYFVNSSTRSVLEKVQRELPSEQENFLFLYDIEQLLSF